MFGRDLYQLRTQLRRNGIVLCYSGSVSEQVLGAIGKALKQKMAVERADVATARRVFAVFVELMQNIIRYSAEKEPDMLADEASEIRYGMIVIGQEGGGFILEAGNMVMRDDVEHLRLRLEHIRLRERSELAVLYKQQLKSGLDVPGSEAGVGFLEIARRASRPIDFAFVDIDEKFCFFTLRAEI